MEEIFYQCPYCWEQVSILVDLSQYNQKYIEDCEVCCNPIEFEIKCACNGLIDFQARSIDQ
tara:strand:+ start:1305 stop:1487 length:183 start_codon:yes stop_codon:yes gene_type:complete